MNYKKFILFAGPSKYPKHGLNDIQGSFDEEKEAIAEFLRLGPLNEWEWYQVVNRDTWQIVTQMEPESMG